MLIFDILLTIVLFIIFIGIIVWAWSPGRKRDFSDAAHLVIEDDIDDVNSQQYPQRPRHG